MSMRESHYLTATFILLASCSSYPQLATGRSGPLPSPGTYQLAQDSNQTGALENALISRLAEEGFSRSDNARYLVQISFSEVPGQTGVYAPRGQSADRIMEVWLTAPSRSRATITRRLVVSFTEAATGTEIYRAHVSEVVRTERSDDGMRLVDALATSLPSSNQTKR